MSSVAPRPAGILKGAVNQFLSLWFVAKVAHHLNQLLATQSMPATKDKKPARFGKISVRDAAAAIARATGQDLAAVERFINEKQAKHPDVLLAITENARGGLKPDA